MKELSIEDKAKAYDEAIDKVAHFIKKHIGFGCIIHPNSSEAKELFNIFPKLKESEDEKIRKWLIDTIKQIPNDSIEWEIMDKSSVLAWLEKQGEQKETLCDKCRKKQPSHSCQDITSLGRCALEKQGEQTSDKVEPKFHKGDWVIDKQGIVHQISNVIENVTNNTYGYDIVGGGYFNDNAEDVRLWTIQDAKDGDVLARNNDILSICIFSHFDGINNEYKFFLCHCGLEGKGLGQELSINGYHDDSKDYVPATKEQRDTLMKAMADAGYTFDFESKELKKIEQKSIEPDDLIEEAYQQQADDLIDMVTENQLGVKRMKIDGCS